MANSRLKHYHDFILKHLVGLFLETAAGNKHITVPTDMSSQWMIAKARQASKKVVTVEFSMKEITCKFGRLEFLVTDWFSEIISDMADICKFFEF